jgi:protein-disulfide isomerase
VTLRSRHLRLRLVILVAGALSCASAPAPAPAKPAGAPPTTAVAAPGGATVVDDGPFVERIAVPDDGPARGPTTAKVTIVEFSDFECPYCARVNPTLERIRSTYPNDVRIVFRHDPLPFHPDAAPAAEAAVAAEWQGKFWEMHDKLFGNQEALGRAGLEARAAELGLDLKAFRRVLDAHAAQARVDGDVALARKAGVRGTPTFLIDGRQVVGAQPFAEFKKIIDDEIARADRLLARGLPRQKLYATLLIGARQSVSPEEASLTSAGKEVYRVPTLDAPVRGGAQPKVTIVEFGDFQCPFTGRVKETLDALLASYGPDLALVYRHNPLSFHANARPAAEAAEAARAQGKFWEMHDLLFAHQQELDRDALDKYARQIGLDLPRFKAAVDGEAGKARIERDVADAKTFYGVATPLFFINGRSLNGAQPIAVFRKAIDEEIRKADWALAAGTPRPDLYAALTKDGLTELAPPPVPAPKQDPEPTEPAPDVDRRIRLDVEGAPARGPADAPVTIVEFADFQCRFCRRVEETLERLRRDYPDQIRFVWRDLPLPMHAEARPAAMAARAAGEQGKFWEMHDRLLAADSLDRDLYLREAAALGLDVGRFRAALEADKAKAGLDADALAAAKTGATGTPSFYVNGKELLGALPYDEFKQLIDRELKITAAMIAKGTPRAKIYAALMKDALPVRPPKQPPPAADNEPSPEDDTRVFAVEPGDAPSKGRADAPLVLVVFSDFQCPYCKRVEPTLAALHKQYGKKLRIVWKNFPLPFHPNAAPAAEAALAADAQGKFWPMHDLLFENSPALERADLEKYAAKLGLDLVRFKADLDAERYKARIASDTKVGNDLGVRGTPVAFINGHKIGGAFPLETFQAVAAAELAKVEGAAAKGKKTAARKAR